MDSSANSLRFRIRFINLSTGVIFNSTFRENKKFSGSLIKHSGNSGFHLLFYIKNLLHKLTIRLKNLNEIIETDDNEIFIKMQGRPTLELVNNRPVRVNYDTLISKKEDSLFKMIFPHFFALKLCFFEDFDMWREYLDTVKIKS